MSVRTDKFGGKFSLLATKKVTALLTLLALLGPLVPAEFVFAARTVTSVTVDGQTQTVETTGDPISVTVNASLTSNDDWRSTGWRIAGTSGPLTCENTNDHTSNGNYSESFFANVPNTVGTYNLYVVLYDGSGCSGATSSTFTLNNAVIVQNNDRTTVSATLNGGSSVTVAPGASIASVVTGSITGGGSGDWDGTDWLIATSAPGTMSCANTSDEGNPGVYTKNISLTAPTLPGVYNAYFRINGNDACNPAQLGTLLTMPNAVTVSAPTGTIVVDKVTVPSGDAQSFSFTTTGAGYTGFSLTDAAAANSQSLPAGNYSVAENAVAGWVQTGAVCVSSIEDTETLGALELDSGETITCTVTNTKLGSLTVGLSTSPDASGATFGFNSASFGGDFTLTDTAGPNSTQVGSLPAGTYAVATTTMPTGWMFNSLTCDSGESNPGAIDLTPGENVTCTASYTKLATFSMEKFTDPAVGEYEFVLTDGVTTASTTFAPAGTWAVSDLIPGSYTLTENIITLLELFPTWSRTIACNGIYSDPVGSIVSAFGLSLPAGEAMSCIVNNTQNAVISGKKFEDMDGNGAANTGSGLPGWTITYSSVDNPETEGDETGAVSGFDVTDTDGNYSFLIPPGTYTVCESPEPSWYQSTSPTGIANINCETGGSNFDYGYTVTVSAGQVVTGKDFGNYRLGSITGVKWHDQNADGVATEDETGLSGWNIELHKDLGEGFEWIDAETTNGSGVYTFTNLAPGVYRVYETQQNGWVQTYPTLGYHTVTVSSGVSVVDKKFGNVGDSVITGTKWIDWNADGSFNGSDSFASTTAFTIELYKVDGESEELASTTSTSLVDGTYTFVGLLPGVYRVHEVAATGWGQTFPLSGADYTVVLGVNDSEGDVDFGNAKTYSVMGYKIYDADMNGLLGEEPGIEGWGITATPMTDTDEGEELSLTVDTGSRSVKTTTTGSSPEGRYAFNFLPSEYGWWRITEEARSGWLQTGPVGTWHDVFIGTGDVTGLDFFNFEKPRVLVEKWKDLNNDGIRNWTEIATGTPGVKDVDEVYSEPAVEGWPMFLVEEVATSSEGVMDLHVIAMAYTSATGTAVLESPKKGTSNFYVYEGDASAWDRTYPADAGFEFPRVVTYDYGVTVPSGFTLDTDANFLVGGLVAGGEYTTGAVNGFEGPSVSITFGNYTAPEPTPTPTTSGGGGGNGPIVGSIGSVLGVAIGPNGGSVAGASTGPGASCTTHISAFMGPNRTNDPEQVRRLQTVLKTIEGMDVDVNGVYDAKTFAAVKAFQMKYADEILKPWGLTTPTGFTYLTTRKKLNEVFCAGMTFPLTPEEQAIIDAFMKKPAATPPAPQPRSTTPPSGNSQGAAAATTQPAGGSDSVTTDTGTTTEDTSGGFFSRIKKWFTR